MSNDERFYEKSQNLANSFRLLAGGSKLYALCSKLSANSFLLYTLCSMLVFGVGCASMKDYVTSSAISEGQISVYLKGAEKVSTDIAFELQSVHIIAEDGTFREISLLPLKINSISLSDKQIIICDKTIPEGRYRKLQFTVKDAVLKREGRTATLAVPSRGISADIDITIRRNQNVPVFLTWNADASINDGFEFSPSLSVKVQTPELSSLLIYVTNEDSDNVSVINRQSGDIVANIMVGKKPRGIAVSQRKEKPKVYVANSASNSISVIDPTVNKVEAEIPLRFGNTPESIAVAKPAPDRELLFIANYGSDNVSVVDGSTYQEIDKINAGNGPVYIATDPPSDTLLQSRFLSFEDYNALRNYRERYFNVYVANKNSRDISLIRMDAQRLRADKVISLGVQWGPITLAVDYQRGKVYAGNYNYENLSVIDIVLVAKGFESGVVSEITNTGAKVTGIIPDPDLDRIYLLKEYPSEITVIRPFSEAFGTVKTTMAPIVRNIPVGDSPKSFVMDPEGRKIYTVNRGDDSVSVIDKTTATEERVIPVGKRPYGIAMFPY